MLEVIIGSLLVSGLGLPTILVSGWINWRQKIMNHQNQEEEEIVTSVETQFEPQEEIAMTQQPLESSGDLQQLYSDPRMAGWEFKIVRAKGNLFRNPAIFQQLCEEEQLAGWVLLEKLDDQRVRFKRPIALRYMINPELLSFDAYRSSYGNAGISLNWLGAIAAILTLIIPAYMGYMYVSGLLNQTPLRSPDSFSRPSDFPDNP